MESGSQPGETQISTNEPISTASDLRRQRLILISIIAGLVVLLALICGATYLLLQPSTPTDRIRDIFIIFMALESLVLGIVLVILIVQLARLINLLQNEIRPILDSTNETVNTLRGTTAFLSDNLVEPVMKMNEYFAGVQQALRVVGIARGKKKNSKTPGE
jgi:hypothetical protein